MNKTVEKLHVEKAAVNTIRTLTIDAIEKAKSGHPGMRMGMAPVGHVLMTKVMKHNPLNSDMG